MSHVEHVLASYVPGPYYIYIAGDHNGDEIQLFNAITDTVDAVDFGDLTVARQYMSATYTSETIFAMGGMNYPTVYDIIEYWSSSVASGSATDKGNLVVGVRNVTCGANDSYILAAGGLNQFGTVYYDTIQYIVADTSSSNAVDKSDISNTRSSMGSVSGDSHLFLGGGGYYNSGTKTSFRYNYIEWVAFDTSATDSSDRGDLISTNEGLCGTKGPNYGYYCGGSNPTIFDTIQYIDKTTSVMNAVDVGDLLSATRLIGSTGGNGDQLCYIFGGDTGSKTDVIQGFDNDITTGNALDKADLTAAESSLGVAGASGY